MQTVKGVVKKINVGPKASSVLLDDGNWYGFGFHNNKPLSFNEGANIQFTFEDAGKWKNVDTATLEILGDIPSSEIKNSKEGDPTKTMTGRVQNLVRASTRDSYWEDKAKQDVKTQKEIRYHAARNAAVDVVKVLIDSESLKLGAQQAKKVAVVEAAIDEYTRQFYTEAVSAQAGTYDSQVSQAVSAELDTTGLGDGEYE